MSSRLPTVPPGTPSMTIAERKVYLRTTYPNKVIVPLDKIDACAEWCNEHCSSDWHNFNGATSFHFSSAADATLFKFTMC